MPFKTIGLSDPLVRGILATGYTAPTEIQSRAIPAAINGRDIIACAQTGTGKTAAFVLPILDRLSQAKPGKARVIKSLILTPTRELAEQIEKAIQGYGRFMKVSTAAIYGGVKIQRQFAALRRGVDIVVSTPGRLIDHLQRGTIDLRNVEVLVLDEADRMLDMGFVKDVQKIIKTISNKRQTLLFSATMSKDVKSLASSIQNKKPEIIQVGKERNPIETITQHICPVQKDLKMKLLLHILQSQQLYSVLIFSRTKHGADKICRKLKKESIKAVAIHSNRTQSQRLQALEGFKRGKFYVMVATDIAARGIDVSGISHVINYDVPTYCEDYIHRIGRTGRAEANGDAITFVSQDEMKYLRRIEQYIGKKFKMEKYDDFDYTISDHPEITPHRKPDPSKRRNKYKKESNSDRPKRKTGGRPGANRSEDRSGKPRRKTSGRPTSNKSESRSGGPKRKTTSRPGANKSESGSARPKRKTAGRPGANKSNSNAARPQKKRASRR